MLKSLSGRRASQNEHELLCFISLLKDNNVKSYLEIGARHGDTFYEVMKSLPIGSVGVAVDFPGALWGTSASKVSLVNACEELRKLGYKIHCIFGDSTTEEVINKVKKHGKFDAALIDGDHTLEGVTKDFDNYKDSAEIIAFHDIVGTGEIERVTNKQVEVPIFWQQLKDTKKFETLYEFVDTGSKMGIGVILN